MPHVEPDPEPCQTCGACCATYRVSFYWAEADALGLPAGLTRPLTPWHACMDGTQQPLPRCVALDGRLGEAVRCTVYEARPSACRELQPGEDKCVRARARHGLAPLAGDQAFSARQRMYFSVATEPIMMPATAMNEPIASVDSPESPWPTVQPSAVTPPNPISTAPTS